jgi:hypothetical protein
MDFDLSAFEYEDDRSDAQRACDAHAFLWHELIGSFEFSLGRRGATPRTLARRAEIIRQVRNIEIAAARPEIEARAAAEAVTLFNMTAAASARSGSATAAPADPQALLGLGLPAITLTPRILSQRPQAARVRAGLLT